ncbi:hypothetical protein K449DRAFT_252143 [Hypoxylon sp. EC38]|nr:hypothetical protein K449DRAFT_252143 [Hypoxylon sp. EC38]
MLLENIATRDDAILLFLSCGLSFKISGTRRFYRAVILLIQSFKSNAEQMCRILHIPTVRSLIKLLPLNRRPSTSRELWEGGTLGSYFNR